MKEGEARMSVIGWGLNTINNNQYLVDIFKCPTWPISFDFYNNPMNRVLLFPI